MADSDIETIHSAFAAAMETFGHEEVVLQTTVSDLVLLTALLAERLRHRHWHGPIRRRLEHVLQECVAQLDMVDPVLWQWVRSYNTAFAFENDLEEEQ